ncbi:hypothetical protein MNEG_9853 [Monoraphidium neglectum]|uniref:Uncharacterized protein n=1 Tax=Monoraphidium neglectum TaxID=145388 RepID=A0A0D2MUP6_9CHLO|nr:hypothetical protein MNEG_9853 [Monoraphidium neglectum]KIY98110.1 hypothetical protein MNEG_9853 [Monoraphidium neglectum]|eukprot:XP_013897130.1 hypothetical protein MNEG_9853 [Monoraphidium neglectum]
MAAIAGDGGGEGPVGGSAQKLMASALSGLEASGGGGRARLGDEGLSGGSEPGMDPAAWPAGLLSAALAAAEASAGGARLPRRAAQRLLGAVRAACEAAARARAAGTGAPEGWPADASLQYVLACCRHGVAPAPALLAEAVAQAAAAPAGALTAAEAHRLLLVQPKRQFGRRQQRPAANGGSGAVAAAEADLGAVPAVLSTHLQPCLAELSAPQLARLLSAVAALGVTSPPPGFAAAAAEALRGRLVLLPKGRQLLAVLEQLLAWGHRPSADFMRSFYAAADLLLDTFSAVGCIELLGACWQAADPNRVFGRAPGAAAAAAAAGVLAPPTALVSAVLWSLEGRSISPAAAAEGLRLLGALRTRPSPALLAHWFDGAARSGALSEMPPQLLLAAAWGACVLRVAPPAVWVDALLEGMILPGRMALCAPATLAGLLRCLQRLGVAPAPAFCAAAAEAAAATAGGACAESISVTLACLASWGATPPAGAVRALALRAADAVADADGASAARLFAWWQAVRSCPEAERVLSSLAPEEIFSVDIAMWTGTLRHLPERPGGGRGTLPPAALAPLFVAAVHAAARDGVAPAAWLDRAWRGAAAAAAADDALTASEAAALLLAMLGQGLTVHFWDLRTAQALLRAGYRAREGAPSEAIEFLLAASDGITELVATSQHYAEDWAASCGSEAPGLPPASAEILKQAASAAAEAELAVAQAKYEQLAQQAGALMGDAADGAAWGTPAHMAQLLEAGVLEPPSMGVGGELRQLQLSLIDDVSAGWVRAGLDG